MGLEVYSMKRELRRWLVAALVVCLALAVPAPALAEEAPIILEDEADAVVTAEPVEEAVEEQACELSMEDGEELPLTGEEDSPLTEEEDIPPIEAEDVDAWDGEMPLLAAAGSVKLDAEHFPDDAFRAHLSKKFDKDGNGTLSATEIGNIKVIEDVPGVMTSAKGVEYLTALKELRLGDQQLTELDISANKALRCLDISNNQIDSLEVRGFSSLEWINAWNNGMTSLTIVNCAVLDYVEASDNALTSFDIRNCPALTDLRISGDLGSLALTPDKGVKGIRNLSVSNCGLNSLDISGCPKIEMMDCWHNNLTTLDVSMVTVPMSLDCTYNPLTSIKLNRTMEYLSCSDTQLASIDLSGCSRLITLGVANTPLTSIDLSHNPKLIALGVDGTNLVSLDTSACPLLDSLTCSGTQIKSLDLSKNHKLSGLVYRNGQLETLSISSKEQSDAGLRSINVSGNPLKTLRLNKCAGNLELDISNTLLESLDLTGCTGIKAINCVGAPMTRLIIADCRCLKRAYNSGEMTEENGTRLYTSHYKEYIFDAWTDYPVSIRCDADDRIYVNSDPTVPTKLTLSPSGAFDWQIDEPLTLVPAMEPEEAESDITWKSSDTKIATVSEGELTFLQGGKVTITATTVKGAKTAKVTINVIDPYKPTGITLDRKGTVNWYMQEPLTLTPILAPETAQSLIKWKSSNEKIATVEDGVVTFKNKTGLVTIAATTVKGSLTARVKLNVLDNTLPTKITLDRTQTFRWPIDEPLKLIPTIEPLGTADPRVKWTTSDKNIATVSDGELTIKKAGTVTITATTVRGKKTASVKIKLFDPTMPTKLTLDRMETFRWYMQDPLTLTASMEPAETADSAIRWSTSDKTIATVSGGELTFKKAGTVTITATTVRGKKSAKVKIKVLDGTRATAVAIVPPEKTILWIGDAMTLRAECELARPVDPENPTNDPKARWQSSNPTAVKVDKFTGEVTALRSGKATITVTTGSKKTATVTLKVIDQHAAKGVSIEPPASTALTVGDTLQLNALVPTVANEVDDEEAIVTWSTANKAIATVSKAGIVTAKKAGKVKITVKTKNRKAATITLIISKPAA